jgi:hypothetical protein
LGPNRAVVPKPINQANRCILRHVTPKTLQKALYVGYFETGKPLPVVCLGWSQFPVPEASLAWVRHSNLYGLVPFQGSNRGGNARTSSTIAQKERILRSNTELSRSRRKLRANEAGEQRISHRARKQRGRRLSAPVRS